MFDVMSMFARPALNRMLQPMLTPGGKAMDTYGELIAIGIAASGTTWH